MCQKRLRHRHKSQMWSILRAPSASGAGNGLAAGRRPPAQARGAGGWSDARGLRGGGLFRPSGSDFVGLSTREGTNMDAKDSEWRNIPGLPGEWRTWGAGTPKQPRDVRDAIRTPADWRVGTAQCGFA